MKSLKILLVEDDIDIQMIAELGLKNLGGHDIKITSNGQEALRALESWTPDLILMDVMMPIMDGPSALKVIKAHAHWSKIPVVFMTAKSTDDELQELRNAGALDIIIKPFDPVKLPARITKIWESL